VCVADGSFLLNNLGIERATFPRLMGKKLEMGVTGNPRGIVQGTLDMPSAHRHKNNGCMLQK
jgi:hypothetical protein